MTEKREPRGAAAGVRIQLAGGLYQLHSPDPKGSAARVARSPDRAPARGKIRHLGISNVNREELEVALSCAEIVGVQNNYSVANRGLEDVLERCVQAGLAFIAWHPLGDGRLPHDASLLSEIAERHGATPSQVAIAWLLQHSPQLVPIPGTSSITHLDENVGACELELEADDIARLDVLA